MILGPELDVYSLRDGSSGRTFDTNNQLLVLLSKILNSPPIATGDIFINDPLTLARLPFVTREDGIRAIPVDTEISIDNATLKINNLFVASTDGLVSGAQYMRLLSAPISDGYTPPTQLLQNQNFSMIYNGTNFDRLWAYNPQAIFLGTRNIQAVMGTTWGFDSATGNFIHIHQIPTNTDNVTPQAEGALVNAALNYGYKASSNEFVRIYAENWFQGGIGIPTTNKALFTNSAMMTMGFTGGSAEWVYSGQNNSALTPQGANILFSNAFGYSLNISTGNWEQNTAGGNDTSGENTVTDGLLRIKNYNYFKSIDSLKWSPPFIQRLDADNIAASTEGAVMSASYLIGFEHMVGFQRLRATKDNFDAVPVVTLGANLNTNSRLYGFNGTTFDRLRSANGKLQVEATTSPTPPTIVSTSPTIISNYFTGGLAVNTPSAVIVTSNVTYGATHITAENNSGAVIEINIGAQKLTMIAGGRIDKPVLIGPGVAITITPRLTSLAASDVVGISLS